ncbi:unnamed protein product [Moneuplotes crassus]|uniref:Uncharacterized protein n=1 Tax=Euplotes crassus TaxID=5936 RepID=A0AAD1XI99_EUPCR|nr:unnamed protein product [Moneuplotes crassus]
MENSLKKSSRSHKRSFEIGLLNEERAMHYRIQELIKDNHTPRIFKRVSRNAKHLKPIPQPQGEVLPSLFCSDTKLVMNKQGCFRKWAGTCVAQDWMPALEIMIGLKNTGHPENKFDKLINAFPKRMKCLHIDFRLKAGFDAFNIFKSSLIRLLSRVTGVISLNYFKIRGKQLSRILLESKNVDKISFCRCSIEEKGFIIREPVQYKIRELCFTNCISSQVDCQRDENQIKFILDRIANSLLGRSLQKLHVTGDSISSSCMTNIKKNEGFKDINLIVTGNISQFKNHQLLPIVTHKNGY